MPSTCHLTRQPFQVLALVFPPDAGKTAEVPYGSELVSIPIFKTVAEATAAFPAINTSLIYVGPDRAFKAAMDALADPKIKLVSMITEGVPEKDSKRLSLEAKKLGKIFNGPSAIGIISAGECRLGVIGGAFDNLILSKLHRPGSFGVIRLKTDESIWRKLFFSVVLLKISAKNRGLTVFSESQHGVRNATGLLFGTAASRSTHFSYVSLALSKPFLPRSGHGWSNVCVSRRSIRSASNRRCST